MTEFMNKSFSVGMAGDQSYRDRWEETFGKRPTSAAQLRARKKYNASEKGRNTERSRKLKKDYGVDQEWFDSTLANQDGKCAICQASEPGGRGTWHIDHDHKTGKNRGLLCQRCNMFLGLAKDDRSILTRAAEYLLG